MENLMIVTGDVALVRNLDEHVGVALRKQPFRRVMRCTQHGRLILQTLVLSEVEITDDRHHPKLVCTIEDSRKPIQTVRSQGTVRLECRVMPRLILRVTFRAAALEINRETKQAVTPPLGHRCNELS